MSFVHKKRKALLVGASAAAVAVLSYAATTGNWFPGASRTGQGGAMHAAAHAGASASPSQSPAAEWSRGTGTPFVPMASRRMPSLEDQIVGGHIQSSPLSPSARLPRQPAVAREHTSYDHGHSRADMLRRPSFRMPNAYRLRTGRAVSAAAACDPNAFQSLSGASLVSAVKSADTSCINSLFNLTGTTAYNTFRESQMVTVANAFRTSAIGYNGTQWRGRRGRIYQRLAPVPNGPITAAWSANGPLLPGRVRDGDRALVFSGAIASERIEDTFRLTIQADGNRVLRPQDLQFTFEFEPESP